MQLFKKSKSVNQFLVGGFALVIGIVLGSFNIEILNNIFSFTASVFTKLFKCIAIPTIVLSVIAALSRLNEEKNMGWIFKRTIFYTILTTFLAAIMGLVLYLLFTPGKVIVDNELQNTVSTNSMTYYEHILSIIPDNIFQAFSEGNVLTVILIAAAIGIGLSFTRESENKKELLKVLYGIQELLFTLIQGLIKILPIGIAAFAAQLSSGIMSGNVIESLGKYIAIVLSGNLIQMFIILPIILYVKKINPLDTLKKMSPALITAFFTKSSASTLPVTLSCAENNLNVNTKVSRFVLPICTTVNMNGCAAFILITSLFIMNNAGFELNLATMIMWVFISVFAAIGNAGVPMGCYFLTASLMSSIGAPLELLGLILPIYTIIDMVETSENVWSDSVVCTIVNRDFLNNKSIPSNL